MSIASLSAVGLTTLVASGYRWVHVSATETAEGNPPFPARYGGCFTGFAANIMTEWNSRAGVIIKESQQLTIGKRRAIPVCRLFANGNGEGFPRLHRLNSSSNSQGRA
jgi:hypothetical protein